MPNHRLLVRTASAIVILLPAISATAPAQQTEPWAGPAFQAPAAALLESAKAIEKTKGYDTTLFMDEVAVSVDEAGRTKQRYRFVFRVEGAEGLTSWATVSVFWDPWHQKQPEVRA